MESGERERRDEWTEGPIRCGDRDEESFLSDSSCPAHDDGNENSN